MLSIVMATVISGLLLKARFLVSIYANPFQKYRQANSRKANFAGMVSLPE